MCGIGVGTPRPCQQLRFRPTSSPAVLRSLSMSQSSKPSYWRPRFRPGSPRRPVSSPHALYGLQHAWVFRSAERHVATAPRYVSITLSTPVVDTGIFALLHSAIGLPPAAA